MPVMDGGYGFAPWGQHQYGAERSDIEPRFNTSAPFDGERDVELDHWIEYEVYYYSSFPNQYDPLVTAEPYVQISENSGVTYVDASVYPFSLTRRYLAGHTVWFKILKDGLWPKSSEIIVKTTLPDEYGQPISKEVPVKW